MHTDTSCTSPLRRARHLLLALLAVLAASAIAAHAQFNDPVIDMSAGGTSYLVAFPDTTSNALDSRYPNTRVRSEASLWIFSAVKNKVKITSNGGASTTLTLEAGKFKIYQIPGSIVADVSGSPVAKALKVESDYPIVLYCYFANIQATEAWTPVPVDKWGTHYSAAAVPGEVVKDIGIAGETEVPTKPKPGPGEILVIAAHDNTTVTLTPPPGVVFANGAPRTVTLNEGQVYQVQSAVDLKNDTMQQNIAATIIDADKPIGVICGNTRAQVNHMMEGIEGNAYKNLMIEWLHPSEEYGREFVYMPTWDAHRPGIGAAGERDREFVQVYSGAQAVNGSYYASDSLGAVTTPLFSVKKDTMFELAAIPNRAIYLRTEKPAQVIMHSSSIVKFNGSVPCFNGLPCLSYSAWAPYMVELAPREQWPAFAPYYAPPNPGGMQHYINVVTDTNSVSKIVRENGSTFLFNRRIPGTDLIWGSMSVSQGEDHWLMGKNGAKFWGFAYGIFQGGEEYRPGRARKKDDAPSTASGGKGNDVSALHPAEYEEYNAVSYGYPLVSLSRVNAPGDSLKIDSTRDCSVLTLTLAMVNANPVGFRSVATDPASVKNAKLTFVDPRLQADIIGRTQVEVRVEPIDPLKNAQMTVIIIDRSGKTWSVTYSYEAVGVALNPSSGLFFGEVTLDSTVTKRVTITNPLAHPIVITGLHLVLGTENYTIIATNPDGPARQPAVPVTLKPGDSMTVDIKVTPTREVRDFVDTLKVTAGCTVSTLPVVTQTVKPVIYVPDIDFGTLVLGVDGAKTRALSVCNIGTGQLRFIKPGDSDPTHLLEWLASMGYTVDPTEIAKLKDTLLDKNHCFTLHVTFTPTRLGHFQVTGRFWASTRDQRDTSVWRAQVVEPTLSVNGEAAPGYALDAVATGSEVMIHYALGKPGSVRVEIFDGAGRLLETIADTHADAGAHELRWDAASRPAGIYFCRVTSGDWTRSLPLVLVR